MLRMHYFILNFRKQKTLVSILGGFFSFLFSSSPDVLCVHRILGVKLNHFQENSQFCKCSNSLRSQKLFITRSKLDKNFKYKLCKWISIDRYHRIWVLESHSGISGYSFKENSFSKDFGTVTFNKQSLIRQVLSYPEFLCWGLSANFRNTFFFLFPRAPPPPQICFWGCTDSEKSDHGLQRPTCILNTKLILNTRIYFCLV